MCLPSLFTTTALQSKAWMNGEILDKVLTKLNRKFSSQHRNVALLLDNAGCHPEELKGKYSNIKFIFLPPNTTSKLQPLDVGIIQNFKVHYRTLLLRYCCDVAFGPTNNVVLSTKS